MIIVSGCPRSGTSLMMDILRTALGDDRIIGSKFPQDKDPVKSPRESEEHFAVRCYLSAKRKAVRNPIIEKAKQMNPNGFFECRYTVKGVVWHLGIDNVCTPEKVCKVVSQGLIHTDPKWVDKIVYMIRDPRAVATSQEKLKRADIPLDELGVVHTPQMFVNVTYEAACWLKEHSGIPVYMMNFDSLVSEPDVELSKLAVFLGEGNFANHPVNKKLRRSEHKELPSLLWKMADTMYGKMLDTDYDAVIQTFEKHNGELIRDSGKHPCVRLERPVSYRECLNCYKNKTVAMNFRVTAEAKGIDWRKEPCLFECGFSREPEFSHKTIDDSIAGNHWM